MADYSWASIYPIYGAMALLVVATALFLAWAVRTGAMSGDEAPKYRMLEEDGVLPGDRAATAREGESDGGED